MPPRREGVQGRTEHPSQRGLRRIGTPPRTALVSPLQRSWRGAGGEDEPAHPNARTPVVAHMFCPPLKGRGMGKPGFPMSQPLLGAAGAPTGRGMGKPGFPICSPQPVYAAAPHTTRMKRFSWEGCALPNPPRWRVVSWEGVEARRRRASTPKPSPLAGYFHLRQGSMADVSMLPSLHISTALHPPTQPAGRAVEVLEMKAGLSSGSEPRLSLRAATIRLPAVAPRPAGARCNRPGCQRYGRGCAAATWPGCRRW